MRSRKLRSTMVWGFVVLLAVISVAGCHKTKPVVRQPEVPPTPSAPAGPAPTLTLTIAPGTIEKGQSATLTWNAAHAQAVTIDPLGPVPSSGSRSVSPATSTTYNGRATAPNQPAAEATARLTVTEPSTVGTPSGPGPSDTTLNWETEVRDIHFDYDRYEIRPEDAAILRQDADVFQRFPSARIIIEGHCDERGTEEYNQALGDRRATATRDHLTKLGVPADRMTAVSFGKTKPLDPGHNEAAWAKNRRAHFARQ